MTLQRRKQLAFILLSISILAATYVAIPGQKGTPPPPGEPSPPANAFLMLVDSLNRVELVHFMGHLLIFGCVALLLGPWGRDSQRGGFRLALKYVVLGGLIMETAQIIVGYSDDYITDLILGTSFDLMTDLTAALVVLALVMRSRYTMVSSSK